MTSPTAKARAARRRLAQSAPALPDDIKADIAAAVRSIELRDGSSSGGKCLFRAAVGYYALALSGISARIELGGMIYRAGPDAWRDTLTFCGPDHLGKISSEEFSAHYYLTTDAGEIVDFAVGDWKTRPIKEYGLGTFGSIAFDSIQWTIDPQLFHWDLAEKFRRPTGSTSYAPELGQAWYSVGYRGGDCNGADLGLFLKHAVEDNEAMLVRRLVPLLKARNIAERIKQVT